MLASFLGLEPVEVRELGAMREIWRNLRSLRPGEAPVKRHLPSEEP